MSWRTATATAAALLAADGFVQAQELEPGACSPAPVGFTATNTSGDRALSGRA